jgi:hypothetical protein
LTILAQSYLTANTNNLVFTMTGSGTVSILLWNSTSATIQTKIGLVPSGNSVGNTSWIDGPFLDGYQPLSREGIPLNTGDMIYVNPSAAGVSCTILGVSPT